MVNITMRPCDHEGYSVKPAFAAEGRAIDVFGNHDVPDPFDRRGKLMRRAPAGVEAQHHTMCLNETDGLASVRGSLGYHGRVCIAASDEAMRGNGNEQHAGKNVCKATATLSIPRDMGTTSGASRGQGGSVGCGINVKVETRF